jgi:hypothetical protein
MQLAVIHPPRQENRAQWWLENKMNPAPVQMGKVYKSLIIDSTVGAVRSLSAIS